MQQSHFALGHLLHIRFVAVRPFRRTGLSAKKLRRQALTLMVCAALSLCVVGASAAVAELSTTFNYGIGKATSNGLPGDAALQPGSVSFTAERYSVREGSYAYVTVKRTGGTDNKVVAKVTRTDVTTTPADYSNPGTLDVSYNYGIGRGVIEFVNQAVFALALQPYDKTVIGGYFTRYNGDENASDYVTRIESSGALDPSFNYGFGKGASNFVFATAVQPDGKIMIGGAFTRYNGDPNASDNLLRLNTDGTLDTSFNYGFGKGAGIVHALDIQPDGKIIIGGNFTHYNGDQSASNYILRVNADGTLDTSFNYGSRGLNSEARSVVVQPDGKILVGGGFTSYNDDEDASDNILRLNADGTLDTSFNYGAGKGVGTSRTPDDPSLGIVFKMALQPDGKILVAGQFTACNGDPNASDQVLRLNANGTLDTSFNYGGAGMNGTAITLAMQPDGKIIVGGNFTRYNGDEDASNNVLRLNTDGTLDTSFNYGQDNGANNGITALGVQPDGQIMMGGYFTAYNGNLNASDGIARLNGDIFATWEAGDASDKTITIPIVNDSEDEGNETLNLTLTPISGGATQGTPSTAALTIMDNDTTVSQVSGASVVGRTATLTARLTSGGAPVSGKTITFDLFDRRAGRATTDANGVAMLSNVSLAGIADGIYPLVVFAIFEGDGDLQGDLGSGTLTVNTSFVQLGSAGYSVAEGAGRATITVTRNVATGPASVQYATSDSAGLTNCNLITINASARCDYMAVGDTLTFAPGELSKTFTIPIINDIFVEAPEALTITLSNPTGSGLTAPTSATVTITDDDSGVGAANPLDTREFLVRQLYLDTLNREPEPSGLAAWLNRLNTCPLPGETLQNCDEIEVASAFFRSPEAFDKSYFIYKFYEGSLIRQPQYDEFQADLRRLAGFLSPEELEQRKQQFAEDFVNRAEFHALYDSFANGQPFVDAVLARAGAARPGAGTATLVTANRISVINRLGAGQINRAQALRELMESAEMSQRFFNKAFVVVEYFSFLRRNPDAAYLHWINVLNMTGDYREMIRGFLQSPEYRSRFGPV